MPDNEMINTAERIMTEGWPAKMLCDSNQTIDDNMWLIIITVLGFSTGITTDEVNEQSAYC